MTTEATNHLKLFTQEQTYFTALYTYVTSKLDDNTINGIPATHAAEFLKMSGLSIDDLKKIWRLSCIAPDVMARTEFFTALKLVALKQQNMSFSVDNLKKECRLPEFSVGPKPTSIMTDSGLSGVINTHSQTFQHKVYNFVITESTANNIEAYIDKKCKTEQKGVLNRREAQDLFSTANLNEIQKVHLWTLCDIEKKGYLNKPQFIVCLYFISQCKQGTPLPNELPHKLVEFIQRYEGVLEPSPSPIKREAKDSYAGLVNLLLKKCLDQQECIQTIDDKNKNILEDLDTEVI